MIKSVTRSVYELNNHQSLLDQVILAINQVMTARPSPLGRDDEVIFWHNHRTNCSPHHAVFGNIQFHAFRIDLVLVVIKNVLKKKFNPNEISRSVRETEWAKQGHCHFYDCAVNGYPIARTILDDTTNTSTKVPLEEEELTDEMMKRFPAVFFRVDKFDEIVNSVSRASGVQVDYKGIEINSSFGGESYNFFNAVTGHEGVGWFGYRVLTKHTFGKYCGPQNFLNVGGVLTERELCMDVINEGGCTIEHLYSLSSLLEHYSYTMPSELPRGLWKIPFTLRNGADDEYVDNHLPPWHALYETRSTPVSTPASSPDRSQRQTNTRMHFSPRRHTRIREDDEQSSVSGGPSPDRRNPGSSPLVDSTQRHNEKSHGSQPQKRRRAAMHPVLQLDDAGSGEDEQVRQHTSNLRPMHWGQMPLF